MKRLIGKITALSLLIMMFSIYTSYAASSEEYVRVRIRSPRLYNEQSSLQGYDDISVYLLDNNRTEELFTLKETKLSVLLDSYFDDDFNYSKTEAYYGPYHVVLGEIYESFEDAMDDAEELEEMFNADFYPQINKEGYYIFGGYFSSKKQAESLLKSLINEGYSAEVKNTDLENVLVYDKDNNALFMYDNKLNIYFSSYNEDEDAQMIYIDKKPYRGYIGYKIIEEARLISINFVELESYLYGVVPNEISASWGIEALKAQAVAARTYAVSCIKPNVSYGYDMDDNQNSQVYRGYISEHPSTTKAVNETKGEKIYYDNKLIQAFYHSTSGGSTENSENVWTAKLPYAVGVEDEFTNRSGSPYNEWTKSYQKSEIIKKLNDDGHDVDDLYSIEITKVSDNNRVMECIFLTDNGEIVYYKENARLLLGLMSSWFNIGNGSVVYFTNEYTFDNKSDAEEKAVPSRGGIIDSLSRDYNEEKVKAQVSLDSGSILNKYVIDSNDTKKLKSEKISVISSSGISTLKNNSSDSDYSFEGRGWGHGIGMSQYGAKQMAQEGYEYDEILKHYYTGVTIKWQIT